MPISSRDETARREALLRYDILDTPPEEAFDRVTRLVRRFLDVPTSMISLIDGERLWFKSRQGMGVGEIPRATAFCEVAARLDRPLVVTDALQDERFRSNPSVLGDPHVRFYAGLPLRTPDGRVIGTLCALDRKPREVTLDELDVLSDLARIVIAELELRRVATTDALTGALTRRAFWEEAERAVGFARRHRGDLSCVVLDLDHFKRVNDSRGHAAGDVVLADTVATIRANLRSGDILGRIGGEEFAIVLPLADAAAATAMAERLREAVARQRVDGFGEPFAVTASFGAAALAEPIRDLDELLRAADAALYVAKAEGRNRCAAWAPAEPAAALAPERRAA